MFATMRRQCGPWYLPCSTIPCDCWRNHECVSLPLAAAAHRRSVAPRHRPQSPLGLQSWGWEEAEESSEMRRVRGVNTGQHGLHILLQRPGTTEVNCHNGPHSSRLPNDANQTEGGRNGVGENFSDPGTRALEPIFEGHGRLHIFFNDIQVKGSSFFSITRQAIGVRTSTLSMLGSNGRPRARRLWASTGLVVVELH
jgi:hypothetical protein